MIPREKIAELGHDPGAFSALPAHIRRCVPKSGS
jgi:hypothetical protein